ncbi:ImmA/IrrE family metallo-endopeptidase [Limnobaculum xujianqingii]|uniref:ImmA/IrrE family metallo-endopeptidase n=1 Tax=Limnobaculum xujianqingii TaxID=2738837 RepID=UPI00112DC9A3|nr:ImmA/IrrE family metallo-endopeptidase [Limnobaculum xujianqingii]
MIQAFINNNILTWARCRASLSVDYIAEKFKKPVDTIIAWEKGNEPISFAQAQRYASITKIPFGYLYLDNPPEEKLPIPDRRTVGGRNNHISIELKDTISDVLVKQDWYREYATSNGLPDVELVGALPSNSKPKEIVVTIKQYIDLQIPPTKGKWKDFFSAMVKKIESQGVLVMRSGVVKSNNTRPISVDDFRGFCIADKIAPVIFINTNDAKAAQLFTLVHEFSHLILGQSAISDLSLNSREKEEMICNAAAAEYLTPENIFLEKWDPNNSIEENIDNLKDIFRVSSWVIARRAEYLKLISKHEYSQFVSKINEKAPSNGGSYNRNQKVRISERLAVAVATQALEGKMLLREAQSLTGIQPNKLYDFARKELGF